MTQPKQKSLPYDMGNAGDLLKHGVMAEFLRARFIFDRGLPIRFFDLFAGEPFSRDTCDRIVRVRLCDDDAPDHWLRLVALVFRERTEKIKLAKFLIKAG